MQDFNYHSHTKRCGHAEGEDEAYVQEAIKMVTVIWDSVIMPLIKTDMQKGSVCIRKSFMTI